MFKAILLLFLFALLSPVFATAAITNAHSLAQALLSNQRNLEFDMTARTDCIVRYESDASLLLLADSSGHAFANGANITNKVCLGDRVHVRGRLRSPLRDRIPDYASYAVIDRLDVVGHETPGSPEPRSVHDILRGAGDWQPTRVRGLVRDVIQSETSSRWAIMFLGADNELLRVLLPLVRIRMSDLTPYVGCIIEADGFPNPCSGTLRIFAGREFHCPGTNAIHVLEADDLHRFAAPDISTLVATPIMSIATRGRAKATGRVLCVWQKHNALIETTRRDIVHLCFEGPLPALGDFIEASGFPSSDAIHLTLAHSEWRPATSGRDIPSPTREAPMAVDFHRHVNSISSQIQLYGRRIACEGVFRRFLNDGTPDPVLLIESDGQTISVDISQVPALASGLEPGSRLRVTGTCVINSGYEHPGLLVPTVTGLSIIVNEGDAVETVARPPFWTPARLLGVITALFSALVGIFIWNRSLNRLAERRGKMMLRERIGRERAILKTGERTRLAVELHDTLAQNLTGVSMEIEAACGFGGSAPPTMMRHLDFAARALKSCRDELRNCLWDLRSEALEEKDMNKAILRTLQPHVNDSRLVIRFNVARSRISDKTAHTLLRVIRELVINALRHGNATVIKVAGSVDREALRCSVTDNGCGFDPNSAPGVLQGHFGIQGVFERIEELDGTVELDSTPGTGTKATITIPTPS